MWRWIPESEQLAAEHAGRELTIRWDDGDQGWFLSVIVPPRPATMGQPATEARVYVTPMPLLVAMVLVPSAFHELLRGRVELALHPARGAVYAHMGDASGRLATEWPGSAQARESLEQAVALMTTVDRLALDLAGAGAMED